MIEALPPGLGHLHVVGDVWSDDGAGRTELGLLLARAKDEHDEPAAQELAELVATSSGVGVGPDPSLTADVVVTSVPPNPRSTVDVPAVLARAVAGAMGVVAEPSLLERRFPTARVRDIAPDERGPLVAAAGYEVTRRVDGRAVVLVDDVILTGTTLAHVAELLMAAGAASVVGVVAARSRRSDAR